MTHSENRTEFKEKCADCKHCKRLYVPPIPSFDHARAVRNRYVCDALGYEGQIQYLGDDEGRCEMFVRAENDK